MLKKSISALVLAFVLVGGIFTASANTKSVAKTVRPQEQTTDKMAGDKMSGGKMTAKRRHTKKKSRKSHRKSNSKMSGDKMSGDTMKKP